jgi:hypothetical protein
MFDYIIIGAGISGLYTGYLLKDYNIVILESSDIIGGRIQEKEFHKTLVQLGAGVIREKDYQLKKLVKQLGLKLINFKSTYKYNINNYSKIWFNKNLNSLKPKDNETMLECITRHFNGDKIEIERFIKSYSYTDYLNANAKLTLLQYPKRDIYHETKNMSIIEGGNGQLIKKLYEYLNDKIHLKSKVKKIEYKNGIWIVNTNKNKYETKYILCCLDHNGLSKIEFKPKLKIVDYILDNIGTNNFLRIYTYHTKINVDTTIVVDTFLKHIIPINQHVIMSGYSDNKNAIKLKRFINRVNNNQLTKFINTSLNPMGSVSTVKDMFYKYWKVGTHYYKSNYNHKKDYFHENGLFILGEMVSFKQGWVEGAISSVNNWYKDFI